MTLVFIFNQFDIIPGPDHTGGASNRGNRLSWGLVLDAKVASRGRVAFGMQLAGVATPRQIQLFGLSTSGEGTARGRLVFPIYTVSQASPGRGRLSDKRRLTAPATSRKARIRGVRGT